MVKESYRFTFSLCRHLCVSFSPSPCLMHSRSLSHTRSEDLGKRMGGVLRSASAIGKSRALPSCENRGSWSRHRQGTTPSLTRPRHLALLRPTLYVHIQQDNFLTGAHKLKPPIPTPIESWLPVVYHGRPPARHAIQAYICTMHGTVQCNTQTIVIPAHWHMI